MSKISASDVAKLRKMTGAGLMDAKKALVESGGDFEKATELLRKKGQTTAAKKGERQTMEGLVHAYIHPGGRVGVLVEVNCETDFVARNETFAELVNDLALHIAALAPKYIDRDDVPADELAKEKKALAAQAEEENKPKDVQAKIVEGRLGNFYAENCLLDQPFVKDSAMTVKERIETSIGAIGENIQVRRFTRYELAG